MIQIPVQQNLAAWTQRTQLDGVDYVLDFAWNGRDGAWYLNISAIDGTALVCGIKLVTNRPLFHRFHHIEGMPTGEIRCSDESGKIPWAGYTDLNNGVDVLYVTAQEIADAKAGIF
jgi:hypothetical protein